MVDKGEPSTLNLQLRTLLQQKVAEFFGDRTSITTLTREQLFYWFEAVVRSALELYKENFTQGMRRMISNVRLRTAINLAEMEDQHKQKPH